MASGLLNPKKSRDTFGHDPKRRPWKPRPQAPKPAVDDRDSDDSSGQSFTGDGTGNGVHGYTVFDNRVRIALNSCSKPDIRELRRKLTIELDQVRSLAKKLEAASSRELGGRTQSQFSSNSEQQKKKKNKKTKKSVPASEKLSGETIRLCSSVLEKLMKHEFGWVFNVPVDFKALGLLDYRKIVKRPMDLGTAKSKLTKGLYKSASEFADDVRLTFRNAMLYNPKGQDVHSMAETLLEMFEERWAELVPEAKKKQDSDNDDYDDDRHHHHHRQRPDFSDLEKPKKPKTVEAEEKKRDMSYEEKQRLSTSLQNLPSEKLDNVVQIIKKRNLGLCQHDDEIEVDIASVDPETLWELDRFVADYHAGLMAQNKRKAELQNVAHKSFRTESESEGSLGSGYRS